MFHALAAAAILAVATTAATAQDFITYTANDSFEDVTFAVESAIIAKGLVVDSVSHVGDMLERTRADMGSTVTIFSGADVYQFCSASVSRKVMEDDPMNVRFCPYGIAVFQTPGADSVTVGYRTYPAGAMQEVQALLDSIVKEALMLD